MFNSSSRQPSYDSLHDYKHPRTISAEGTGSRFRKQLNFGLRDSSQESYNTYSRKPSHEMLRQSSAREGVLRQNFLTEHPCNTERVNSIRRQNFHTANSLSF